MTVCNASGLSGGARHQVHAPNDVRDGQGRKFLQLQLNHLRNLRGVAGWHLDGAQKNLVRRQPGDVEFGAEKGLPILGPPVPRGGDRSLAAPFPTGRQSGRRWRKGATGAVAAALVSKEDSWEFQRAIR